MNETKKEIAQKFITGLSNRDANLLRSIMTDDVVWSLPGKSLMSGEAHQPFNRLMDSSAYIRKLPRTLNP